MMSDDTARRLCSVGRQYRQMYRTSIAALSDMDAGKPSEQERFDTDIPSDKAT